MLVFSDKEEAAYYLNDLEQIFYNENKKTKSHDVLFYPGSYRRPYQIEDTDNSNILLRAEVLNRINSQKKPAIIVTYADPVAFATNSHIILLLHACKNWAGEPEGKEGQRPNGLLQASLTSTRC